MSRFGDTAANAGALAALEGVDIPVSLKTACASLSAGLFRILLMPIDALKTSLQVCLRAVGAVVAVAVVTIV